MEVADSAPVTVYWRPGCPYCGALRRGLRRAGLPTTEVNIWSDPQAAARVRSVTGGYETVPTVDVGGTWLVNPRPGVVVAAARAGTPQGVLSRTPLPAAGAYKLLPVLQWAIVVGLLAASFALEAAGHEAASWAVDGLNLLLYGGLRVVRRRLRD